MTPKPSRRVTLLTLLTTAFTSLLPARASAGEFFEKGGAALRGYDPVSYFLAGAPAKGLPEHTATYKGSTFFFASKANREAFVAEPEKYAPQYGGYCAYGAASGYKAAIDPTAFSVRDGKLYLNYNAAVQKKWNEDVPGYISKADKAWPGTQATNKVHE